jgi:hypothetical protein
MFEVLGRVALPTADVAVDVRAEVEGIAPVERRGASGIVWPTWGRSRSSLIVKSLESEWSFCFYVSDFLQLGVG